MTSPGICLLTSPPDTASFGLGGRPGLNDSRLRQAKEILELMGSTFINASFSGMSIVLGCLFGQAVNHRRARDAI
jgi:hypothetical protein